MVIKETRFQKLFSVYKVAVELNYVNQKSLKKKRKCRSFKSSSYEPEAFSFIKTGEEELKLADQFKDIKRVIEEERKNKDNEDPKYITLKEELERH